MKRFSMLQERVTKLEVEPESSLEDLTDAELLDEVGKALDDVVAGSAAADNERLEALRDEVSRRKEALGG